VTTKKQEAARLDASMAAIVKPYLEQIGQLKALLAEAVPWMEFALRTQTEHAQGVDSWLTRAAVVCDLPMKPDAQAP